MKKIEIMENVKLRQYDILFTIKDEKNKKEYVIYTDINSDIDIYVGTYSKETKQIDCIEDIREQNKIMKIFEIVKEEIS